MSKFQISDSLWEEATYLSLLLALCEGNQLLPSQRANNRESIFNVMTSSWPYNIIFDQNSETLSLMTLVWWWYISLLWWSCWMANLWWNCVPPPIAKTRGTLSIRHQSDTFISDRCLTYVNPKVFAIWDEYSNNLVLGRVLECVPDGLWQRWFTSIIKAFLFIL